MKHGLRRHTEFTLIGHGSAGIRIAVETWEVAARYLQPDTVSRAKNVAGNPRLNRDRVDLPRLCETNGVESVAIAEPEYAVAQVARVSVGEDIDELGGEVRVRRCGGYVNDDPNRTRDFEVLLEGDVIKTGGIS